MKNEVDFKLNVETKEAKEAVEDLTDAVCDMANTFSEFPPNVLIRNCDGCTFHIYPSQTRIFSEEE